MKEFRPLQIDWNEIYSGGQRKKVLKQWSLHERQFNRNHVKVIPKGVTLTINVNTFIYLQKYKNHRYDIGDYELMVTISIFYYDI